METISINFIVPQGWHELSDKQLSYAYQLIASELSDDEIKTMCLLKWSGTKVVGRKSQNSYLLKRGDVIFEVTPFTIASLLPHIDWLGALPSTPTRLTKINRHAALPADFSDVPFETFIICDNLYQGYLTTQNDTILDQLGAALYGHEIKFKPYERISIFYWFASLKDSFAKKYADFFQPLADDSDNQLGTSTSVEEAMNAQIRALTKGDITKEAEVLAMPTHRALVELNAQAREYRQINAQLKKNAQSH